MTTVFRSFFISTIVLCFSFSSGLFAEEIELSAFNLEGPSALEAMERIREARSLSDEHVGLDVVSEILWAAHGVTYSGGNSTTHGLDAVSGATLNAETRYTLPVAWYRKFLKVYYMSPEAVYEYNSDEHSLIKLSDKHLMNEMGGRVPDAAG